MFTSIALAALAAAQASSGVKWVPLGSSDAAPAKAQTAQPEATVQPSQAYVPPPALIVEPPAAPPAPTIVSSAAQQPLHLTCVGAGTASKATGALVNGYGGWATIMGSKDRDFRDQVDVRLFNGDDRIRMPRSMLPGIRGGDAGWFKLKSIVADARAIRASAVVNVINNPKVFIDRVTGTISSGKSGDYSGQCDIIDARAPARF